MKNYFKASLLISFLTLCTFTGKASEAFPLLVADKESKTLILNISPRAEVTSLKLLDETNRIIYSQTISKKEGGVRELDMKRFSDGIYTFETDDALRKMEYTISKNGMEFEVIGKKEVVKPLVKLDGKKLHVLFLNKDSKSARIILYDAKDRVLISEISTDTVIQETYNMGRTYAGKYTVEIEDSNGLYKYEVHFE